MTDETELEVNNESAEAIEPEKEVSSDSDKPKTMREIISDAYDETEKSEDARNKVDFAAGFIPGSINIQGNNSFATWAGWYLTYDEKFILLADESQLDDLTRKLMRIGLDNIIG